MAQLDFVLAARPHLRIVSHDPGVVTLQFDFAVLLDAPELGTATSERLLRRIPGIRNVELGLISRRVTISYDPARIPDDWWKRLIAGDEAEAREVVDKLEASLGDA
jgi:hypothetical protein